MTDFTEVDFTKETHLLTVFPHPDDEAFGCTGYMALCIRRGIPVTHVCLTRGQMGRNMGKPPQADRETLPRLRERELRDAMKIVGVDDCRVLDYWDKTLEFEDPVALADVLADILRDLNPSTVITFHPDYGGHPDHEATGRAVRRALQTVYGTQTGQRETRPRLLTIAVPRNGEDRPTIPQVVLDIQPVRDVKLRAFRAHASQTKIFEEQLRKDEALQKRFAWLFREERFGLLEY